MAPDALVAKGAASQRRRLALLAVLAATGDAGVTREKLIGLFWPDFEEERARAALAQALYALRNATGLEDLVLGTNSLRLNEAALPSDVGQFRKAIADQRWADAVQVWDGPFLDGVVVSGAVEFEQWVDSTRGALTREVVEALERLAIDAEAADKWPEAVRLWQRRVAIDPLTAGGTLGLMRALVNAGDPTGAIRHARVYETLIAEQLELPPDPAVRDLAEHLKSSAAHQPVAPSHPSAPIQPIQNGDSITALANSVAMSDRAVGERTSAVQTTRRPTLWWAIGVMVLIMGSAVWAIIKPEAKLIRAGSPAEVLAVGGFRSFSADLAPAARALTDMLATNLAQVPGLNVISSVRVYELAAGIGGDTTRALMTAARQAGATHVIDGAVYDIAGSGGVRLDLRRTSLSSGEVVQALSVTGPDVFAAVDAGTARLLEILGGAAPNRPVADVTTSSLIAYRLYVEGLRAFSAGHRAAAHGLFSSALTEDSTFAMAAYYAALTGEGSRAHMLERLGRAVRLSDRAADRERLLIQWHWANEMDDPQRTVLAETLVSRYASEPFAHLHYGRALAAQGRYGEAIAAFRQTIALDRNTEYAFIPGRCMACEARVEIIWILRGLDSLEVAEREARQAIRVEPSPGAWLALAEILTAAGRAEDAEEVFEHVAELTSQHDLALTRVIAGIRHGTFETVDAELLRRLRTGNAAIRGEAEWWLAFSYRAQGRLADATEIARTLRERDSTWGQADAAPYLATVAAAVLFEQGRYRQAAALWDSIANLKTPGETASRLARHRVWFTTLASTGLAAAGDTVTLSERADTIEALGRQSAFIRDQQLHHHVRGLLYAARGRHEEAVEAFGRARLMPTVGYSRTAQAMARSLSLLGRHQEAIAVLRPFLAGPLDGPNTYLPLTEIHQQLAETYVALGRTEQANIHARRAVAAWRGADASFEARRRSLEDITLSAGSRR